MGSSGGATSGPSTSEALSRLDSRPWSVQQRCTSIIITGQARSTQHVVFSESRCHFSFPFPFPFPTPTLIPRPKFQCPQHSTAGRTELAIRVFNHSLLSWPALPRLLPLLKKRNECNPDCLPTQAKLSCRNHPTPLHAGYLYTVTVLCFCCCDSSTLNKRKHAKRLYVESLLRGL